MAAIASGHHQVPPTPPSSHNIHSPSLASHDFGQEAQYHGYDQIAQNLRRALRDDDVEMEDASEWPTSWDNSDDEQDSPVEPPTIKAINPSTNGKQLDKVSEEKDRRIIYIALDTNIFISHLKTVQSIHDQLLQVDGCDPQHGPSTRSDAVKIKLLVPNIVIHELDKQKNLWNASINPMSQELSSATRTKRDRSLKGSHHAHRNETHVTQGRSSQSLAAAARTAIEWLLRIRQAQRRQGNGRSVHTGGHEWIFQTKGEVMKDDFLLKADDRILDCCEYYQNDIRVYGAKNDVVLWTDDKNLSLQSEIHDIPCIGNRAYSAQQVVAAAQEAVQSRLLDPTPPSSTRRATTSISPLTYAAHASPQQHHQVQPRRSTQSSASNVPKDHKTRNRGITSSIWANSAQSTRKQKTSVTQNGKARASSLPLLTASAANRLPHSTHHPHASQRANLKVIVPPRLADAIVIVEHQTPTPSSITIALAHVIAFPLYDLLLTHVCRGQPAILRQFLGAADLGPGHWNGVNCLNLLLKGWHFGLHTLYTPSHTIPPPIPPHIFFGAMTWLQAFLAANTSAELLREDAIEGALLSDSEKKGMVEAIGMIFVRDTPQWWLDSQHVHAIERLIDWIRSAPSA